jgi:hypothetical protein
MGVFCLQSLNVVQRIIREKKISGGPFNHNFDLAVTAPWCRFPSSKMLRNTLAAVSRQSVLQQVRFFGFLASCLPTAPLESVGLTMNAFLLLALINENSDRLQLSLLVSLRFRDV